MPLIEIKHDDAIGTLILNQPKKRNALSTDLIAELISALQVLEVQKCRAVILRSSPGSKVWSAGHDVRELPLSGRDPLAWSDPLRKAVRAVEDYPHPVIAMIEGGVWGGACELVFACDLILAAPNATFAITPAKLGVPYNLTGLLNFMNRAAIAIIKEMIFTAEPIEASRAESVGIVNYVLPVEELEERTYALARRICRNSPLSISVMKEQLRILATAHAMSPRGFERIQGLRRAVYDSEDYREGIQSFLEKRPARFTGK